MDKENTTGFSIGKWKIVKRIGEGSFGNIFSAVDASKSPESQTEEIAIKTEDITNVKQMLFLEYNVYRQFEGVEGFPHVLEYAEKESFSYLAMQKLSLTLDKCAANFFADHFVPKDILLIIMRDTLKIIEKFHQKGYLYRDVKPANFMVKQKMDEIFIIDFGLCKKYLVNGRHIPMKEGKKLVGTPMFCSLNTHAGLCKQFKYLEQSRRDDIESWVLMILYLSINLPWQPLVSRKDMTKQQQYQKIYERKKETNWEEIIKENQKEKTKTKIPLCLIDIIKYVERMKFEESVNYSFIFGLIEQEYLKSTGLSIKNKTLSWKSNLQNGENQATKNPPNKIRKINFKAPLRNDKKHILENTNTLNS